MRLVEVLVVGNVSATSHLLVVDGVEYLSTACQTSANREAFETASEFHRRVVAPVRFLRRRPVRRTLAFTRRGHESFV